MKKLLCLLMLTTLLFGCADAEKKESSVEEAVQETSECTEESEENEVSVIVDYDETVHFETEKRFLNAYRHIKGDDAPPILKVEYDKEKYNFGKIILDVSHYTYVLGDNETDRSIFIEVASTPHHYSMSGFLLGLDGEENELKDVMLNGNEYEVCLWTGQYDTISNYHLSYMPEEEYMVTIWMGGNPEGTAKEEITVIAEDLSFTVYIPQ